MNKKLLIQIWNERHGNVAVFIELMVVSVVLWIVVDQLYIRYKVSRLPKGFDIAHTYLLSTGVMAPGAYLYDPQASGWEEKVKDMGRLLDKVAQAPEVEVASLSLYSYPYHVGNVTQRLRYKTLSGYYLMRQVDPAFFRVFRYEGTRGETPEELAGKFVGQVVMCSGEMFDQEGVFNEELLGECLRVEADSLCHRMVAAVKGVRYEEYQHIYNTSSFLVPLQRTDPDADLCVRLKPAEEQAFLVRMKKEMADYRSGNVFVQRVQSFETIREDYLRDNKLQDKMYYAVMGFLLVNVCISLLAIFTFRTRQRKKEIALQLAYGSTRKQAFIRLVSEGLFLLSVAAVPAFFICYYIGINRLWGYYFGLTFDFPTFLLTFGITFLMISLAIVGSIGFPARRASRVSLAETLHED